MVAIPTTLRTNAGLRLPGRVHWGGGSPYYYGGQEQGNLYSHLFVIGQSGRRGQAENWNGRASRESRTASE